MSYKKLITYINAENEYPQNVLEAAKKYALEGADEVFLYNYATDDATREEFLHLAKKVGREIEIPFMIGLYVPRFEDMKKGLYTGAERVVVKETLLTDKDALVEGISRFGGEKVWLEVDSEGSFTEQERILEYKEFGIGGVLLKHVEISESLKKNMAVLGLPIVIRDSLVRNNIQDLMELDVVGVATNYYREKSLMKAKISMKENRIPVNLYESTVSFDDFKLNADGLIPVVAQDYRTNEVLMLAYMNKESFEQTIRTGRMTYYSRSRQELWCKGDTSGHYQYMKSLNLDCDNDTILAKVYQVGAACHTGNRSCFFNEIANRNYEDMNPLSILTEDYETIVHRKKHPKEGSYTNYLFDKGIDKILKKCGEEAAEIIIAAKNPDAEELKYEIADFLYHMMVLMAECNLDWNDIVKELVNRRQ